MILLTQWLALVCAVFIVLTCNIVTGIMLGFVTLVAFYAGGWAI